VTGEGLLAGMDNPAPHAQESLPVGGGVGTAVVSSALSDRDLVRACREGSERAWAVLVERFSRYVYAIARQAYRLADHDAEDVFQEVFARTYEHLARLRDDEAIRPWIGQLTRRLAIDRLRAASREQPGTEAIEVVAEDDADSALERIELALEVRAAMATLPDHCQEILDRFFAQEQSYHEIATALEIPMGTIASRISRCLTKLRKQLES
jgi:RNA polymerase sigma factor (sigma-70 family)